MVKINVIITHSEKPSAVHLDKYGLTMLDKDGKSEIIIEKGDLKALQKQGQRDDKFKVEEVPQPKSEESTEKVEEVNTEPAVDPAAVKGGKSN